MERPSHEYHQEHFDASYIMRLLYFPLMEELGACMGSHYEPELLTRVSEFSRKILFDI